MRIRTVRLRRLPWRWYIEIIATAAVVLCIFHMISNQAPILSRRDRVVLYKKIRHQDSRSPTFPGLRVGTESHVAIVICSGRLEEGLVSIKSAVVMAARPMHLHVFVDEARTLPVTQYLVRLKKFFLHRLNYNVYTARYPPVVNHTQWFGIYAPCATLRLFFPEMLRHLSHLIYVDSDTIFVRPPEQLWDKFNDFGAQQILGASYDRIIPLNKLILKTRKMPQYTPGRLQSGVLLMDLDRMRSFGWTDHMIQFNDYWRYKDNFTGHLFDQAAINLAFFFNPEKLFVIDCDWNLRPYHFKKNGHKCSKAEENGASLVHGCQYAFHSKQTTAFTAVYGAFRKFQPEQRLKLLFDLTLNSLLHAVQQNAEGEGLQTHQMFLKHLQKHV